MNNDHEQDTRIISVYCDSEIVILRIQQTGMPEARIEMTYTDAALLAVELERAAFAVAGDIGKRTELHLTMAQQRINGGTLPMELADDD